MIAATTALREMYKLDGDIMVAQGGTSSGKTFSINLRLADILFCIPKHARQKRLLVVGQTIDAAETVCKDFMEMLELTGRYVDDSFNRNKRLYTVAETGASIRFMAFDKVGKAKANGKRLGLFLNEANHIPWEIAKTLIIRSDFTFIDYNPDRRFWVHDRYLESAEHGMDVAFCVTTYRDNEMCQRAVVKMLNAEMRRAFYDPDLPYYEGKDEGVFHPDNIRNVAAANWCKVYVFGGVGGMEGRVFPNVEKIKELPFGAVLLGYGMDYGYANDPTVVVAVYRWLNPADGRTYRILDEVCYKTGILPDALASLIPTKHPVYPDPARPDLRDLMKKHGVNVQRGISAKHKVDRIALMHEHDYLITARSENVWREMTEYTYKKDKFTGRSLNEPVEENDHCPDAISYHEFSTLTSRLKKSVKIKAHVGQSKN